MKTYKYQLHTHTAPCSDCAQMTPEELAEGLYESGYQGCVVTNHFLYGNTGLDRNLPWNEFVRQYELDHIACCRYAEKYDLDIIFGIEENVSDGLEMLCYGITPEILYAHKELSDGDYKTWYRVMHSYGVLCIQAHPFRDRACIRKPGVLPFEFIDGMEVYNGRNDGKENQEAVQFAKTHPELIFTVGADAHTKREISNGGIEVTRRIRNGRELVEVLKRGEYTLLTGKQ